MRERDNLPNGDIDRTHRQQAIIDYVIWKLGHEGVLSDLGQLTSLLDVAKKFVITDSGWQILNFASEMKSLTGKNLTFQTAPYVTTDGHIDGQDVNIVNPAAIKQAVNNAFYPPPPAPKPASTPASTSLSPAKTTVDVYNGGNTPGLACQLSQALTSAGFKAGQVANIPAQQSTQVLYGTGAEASAAKIAGYFSGVTAAASPSVAAGQVKILLGADATSVPPGITSAASSHSTSSSASTSPASTPDNSQSAPVTVKDNAPFGIPCVY